MRRLVTYVASFLVAITLLQLGNAFFQFFQQEDTHEEAERWEQPAGAGCTGYICHDTGSCVSKPIECPCPVANELKCLHGDWYMCIRADQSCGAVLASVGSATSK
ncbi:hypothetical protein SeLEV6574_g01984 [Synchytrium endobioticum]|nr:hypothetical protein SeLEV6574_g01984 [Synchytrium endobioticum]